MPGGFFDAEIAGERIYKIITQSIAHMKVLATLESFKRSDWQGLKELMEVPEYLTVVYVCRKYLNCDNLPIPCEDHLRHSNSSGKDAFSTDIDISSAIKYLSKNKAASDYCLNFPITDGAHAFLSKMEELSDIVKERISRTPDMNKEHVACLKKLYSQNVKFSEKIVRYQNKIEALEALHLAIVNAKEEEIMKTQLEIKKIRDEFRETVREQIEDSEEQMIKDWKSSEFRQVDLNQEIRNQTLYFENLLKEKMAKEKELRTKRYKLESQLASVLEQYDIDISERQKQKEELVVQLEEGRIELEQLEERYNAQELEFRQLTTDRENWDQRRFNEKILAIRQQIAARTIQRAFRKYMRHKYGKKKMKKLTKGKGKKGKGK